MKAILILTFFLFLAGDALSQKNVAIFLVHSTGNDLYTQGKVSDWVKNYNSANGTNFQISTRTYPDKPWPWANYPYDYWKLWVGNSCNNSDLDIECLPSIADKCGLVIFKHCFPGSAINADTGSPDVSSNRQSVENYKLQYRALRTLMDGMPDKKFMVWTLVPLHRLATTPEVALRANEFVTWVKTQWLQEDGKTHPNIFIFDFFSQAAELNENPANGKQYCLKYEYEYDHTTYDSHPNVLANQTIGPLFADAVVKVLKTNFYVSSIHVTSQTGSTTIAENKGQLRLLAEITPADALIKSVTWSIENLTGKATINSEGLITAEKNGTVRAIATATDESGISGEIEINITNQAVLVQSISITDNLGKDTITGLGKTILLAAQIAPQDASDQTVKWSVENLTGKASIDTDGKLTTISYGTIKVIAQANDESKTISEKNYLIDFPSHAQTIKNQASFKAYVNPSSNKVHIQIEKIPSGGVVLEISNITGQKMYTQKIFDTITEWIPNKLFNGILFITITDNNKPETQKLLYNSR